MLLLSIKYPISAVNISAIINVNHIIDLKVIPAITRFEKTNATGMTSTNCLKTEITSDCGPALSAWYIPWKEILNPANKKLIYWCFFHWIVH